MSLRSVFAAAALTGLAACSSQTFACGVGQEQEVREATASQPATITSTKESSRFRIVFLGDSVTAGLGLLSEDAYPALIGRKFADEGYANVEIVNAGISGDTTAGAARRIADGLEADTKILVVALGGNDALRGLTTTQTRENLATIIETAQEAGTRVLLAGMESPPNLGEDYQTAFRSVFIQLARQYRANLVYMPFLLEGVAANPALNQPDGIHPNKEGAKVIADNMYPKLRSLVDQLGGG